MKPVAVLHTLSDAVKAKLGPVDISAIFASIAEIIAVRLEGVRTVRLYFQELEQERRDDRA